MYVGLISQEVFYTSVGILCHVKLISLSYGGDAFLPGMEGSYERGQ